MLGAWGVCKLGGVSLLLAGLSIGPVRDTSVSPTAVSRCDSTRLEGLSCTNPGRCVNACAFWCGSATTCRQCCMGFDRAVARRACQEDCTAVWGTPADHSGPSEVW